MGTVHYYDTPPNGLKVSSSTRRFQWASTILLAVMTATLLALTVLTLESLQTAQMETQEGIAQVEAQVQEGASTSQEVTRQLAALQCILLIEPSDRTVDNTNMCIDDAGIRPDGDGG